MPQRTLRGEDSATLTTDALAQEPFRCANCGCVAVNASDLATALVALDAQVKTTQRTLAIGDLFAAAESKSTVLAADELIEEIAIPAPQAGTRQRYLKFRIRNAIDFPIVGVAFRATVEGGKFHDARVVLGAVAPIPLRARAVEALLEGQAPSAALADEAARLAVADTQPLARNRAKVEIVKALVRQAVLTARSDPDTPGDSESSGIRRFHCAVPQALPQARCRRSSAAGLLSRARSAPRRSLHTPIHRVNRGRVQWLADAIHVEELPVQSETCGPKIPASCLTYHDRCWVWLWRSASYWACSRLLVGSLPGRSVLLAD